MLKNLTPRERFLALGVGSLVPILLLFWAFTSFSKSWFANRQQITGIQSQIMDEQDLQNEAAMAQQRRFYYRDHSLPSNPNMARIQYEAWLNDMLENQAGLKVDLLEPQDVKSIRYRPNRGNVTANVGQQFSWKVVAKGNLGQLLKMLKAFNSLEMIHRITSIDIKPQTVGGSGSDAGNRTGVLRIDALIEVISLVDSEAAREFRNDYVVDDGISQKMVEAVMVRNIFGPANIPPRITSSSSKTAETGDLVTFDITAEDPDGSAGINFELLDCDIAGAVLTSTGDPMKVMFESPALPENKYTFKVRATDGGFPAKTVEKSFSLTVKEKRIVEEKPEPPKPIFLHTQATRITAITTDRNGRTTCWIHVQTTNDRYQPGIDESFVVDKQKWTVKEIQGKAKQVIFEVDNQLVTVAVGSTLDKPLTTEVLTSGPTVSDDSPPPPIADPAVAARIGGQQNP